MSGIRGERIAFEEYCREVKRDTQRGMGGEYADNLTAWMWMTWCERADNPPPAAGNGGWEMCADRLPHAYVPVMFFTDVVVFGWWTGQEFESDAGLRYPVSAAPFWHAVPQPPQGREWKDRVTD